MRKRINRHIEQCPACTERKRRELAPALLLGLAPLAALPIAAMPHGLRAQVLRLASSDTPEAVAHRASVAQRAATFGHHGFPKPVDAPRPRWRTRRAQSVAVGAAAVAAAAVVAGLALGGGLAAHHGRSNALGPAPAAASGALAHGFVRGFARPLPAGPEPGRRSLRCRRAGGPGVAGRRAGRLVPAGRLARRPGRRLVRTWRVALGKRAIVQPGSSPSSPAPSTSTSTADQQALLRRSSAAALGR